MKFNWKIGGEAGFGIMTSGLSISKIATHSGYHIYDYNEYPSLIRGGHNTYEVCISDIEVHSMKWNIDLLVCLNKDTFEYDKHRLTSESLIIYDPAEFEPEGTYVKVAVPFKKLRAQFEIQQLMVNTIALGASLAAMQGEIEVFYDIIKNEFSRKGEAVVAFNEKLARSGFEYVRETYPELSKAILTKKEGVSQKMVMMGNDSFALSTVAADCRFYAAYPMTPSSSVLMSLAAWQYKSGMVIRHSEDEIAVINSALGASFAGVRSAVGTSGGGFALMVEAISYAGIAEIPIVVYLGQRPGPATGMPTWTEQGDLLFTTQAGHGEFPKIVLAPGDIAEMNELTLKAFDLADIYQTPVIVMSDKLLGESHKSEEKEKIMTILKNYVPNRGKIVKETKESPYLRYKFSEDGISEQLIPGQSDVFYQANSYEHLENTHTTEDSEQRKKQVDKRQQKWATYLKDHFVEPKIFGDEKSDIVFVSWGGNKGAILEAQKILEEYNRKTGFIHFTHLFPLNSDVIAQYFQKNKRYILIENNSHAQFGQLLRMQTGIEIKEKLLKYDGRPFWPEEIAQYIMPGLGKVERSQDETTLMSKLIQFSN